jgi:hypothetical protein
MKMRRLILAILVFAICSDVASRAGGPAFIAGSGYASGVEGQPMIWANGAVQYFTDQGSLSAILTGAQADALVATAFGAWTSIPGVSLAATQAGHLAEDVNGSNIGVTGGTVTAPVDITASAIGTPVGIVYDFDGTVTDALLGQGAGGLADCFTNAVYGGPDNFSSAGNIVHALVVINGVCAATTAQLADVQYRLVRVIGRVIGLGWSQANVNVLTLKPPPISDDYAGFPVMHFSDPISCVPITVCYGSAAVPKMDDADALARLYPSGTNPQPAGRVYGGVYFTDAAGNAGQMMQGVNVVARLIDTTGKPSRRYVVTSVSGFAFHGNVGNIVNGYVDANGLRYDRWGAGDVTVEGYFDLGELTIPTGQTIAEYQLSVEAVDTNWSTGVAPYSLSQVTPSGTFAPVVVTVANGSNAERDILMEESEIAGAHPGSGSTYANPAAMSADGGWGSWISGYGSTDWFEFTAQANRTASVSVIALDETGAATESKLLPVIGIWQLSDESGNPAPAATNFAFNTTTWGMSRLDAQFGASEQFRVGVADFRGDGRPDYFYQATLLYSDAVTPSRLSMAGGLAMLTGTGFNQGEQISVSGSGSGSGSTLSASGNRIEALLPTASQDGLATIQVMDPVSGGFSQMIGALTYGAAATDLLLLLQGVEQTSAVGAPANNPIRVRAVAADGITPVHGATLAWGGTNGLQFSACGGLNSCSVLSDSAGESSSLVTPTAVGVSTITVALAPASYTTPRTQQTSVLATSTALDLAATAPTRWVGQGATLSIPLTVQALNLGVPKANVIINYLVTNGTASLSASSATTNASGYATVTVSVTNLTANVQVSACVAPNNVPCQMFTLFATPSSLWKLETVGGSSQFILSGQTFQPLVIRVTDGSLADNPVMGVNVIFSTTLAQIDPALGGGGGGGQGGESLGGGNGMPIILGSSQMQVMTSVNGLASMVPSTGNVGPCDVFIGVNAGSLSAQFEMESDAAIVARQPAKMPGKSGAARLEDWSGRVTSGSNANLSLVLFAIPQGGLVDAAAVSGTDISSTDSSPKSCAAVRQESTGGDDGENAGPSNCDAASQLPRFGGSAEDNASARPNQPKQKIDKPQPDTEGDKKVDPADLAVPILISSTVSALAPLGSNGSAAAKQNSADSDAPGGRIMSLSLQDKRSCRFALSE